jgi:hypothetical protein
MKNEVNLKYPPAMGHSDRRLSKKPLLTSELRRAK